VLFTRHDLHMQLAVVEFTRNVLGREAANSTEFDQATPEPCVVFMPEGSRTHKGGTMRLGTRRTLLQTADCVSAKLYQVRARLRFRVSAEVRRTG
jgi:CTP synthase